ncbi:MAG: DUF3575 domain-containing protein [Rikenellaceae bacterium]|nr:DUF3575 domain-containing protein [Rikenellaceae bacterium]
MRFAKLILALLPLIFALSAPTRVVAKSHIVCPTPEHKEIPTPSTTSTLHEERITFHFRHNNSLIDTLYADNASSYARLRAMLAFCDIADINICGAASPVGREGYNREIALRRAEAARALIESIESAKQIPIVISSTGEEWAAFTTHIEQNYHRRNRDKVLEILHSELPNAEKKRLLWILEYDHTTWRYLVRRHMASSRNTVSVVVHLGSATLPTNLMPDTEISPLQLDELILPTPQTPTSDSYKGGGATSIENNGSNNRDEASVERKMVLAARTNLLVPALNIGLEVPIGTNWSVGAEYYYPWIWPSPENRNCFELLAWNIEGRYWFGRERTIADRLQGHAIGLYAGGGYYDVQHNFKGHQGEFADVGIDYTYALPVAKGKLHMEFSLGVGYIYSVARPYAVAEKGGDLLWRKQLQHIHYFGPTRLNIALTVPIFKRIKREGGNE